MYMYSYIYVYIHIIVPSAGNMAQLLLSVYIWHRAHTSGCGHGNKQLPHAQLHQHKYTNTNTHIHTHSNIFTHARTQHTQTNRCSRTVPHGQKSTATPTAGCAQTSAPPCRSSSTTARWVSGSTATHSFSTPRTMRVRLASSLAMPLPWLSMPASCNTLMRFNV